MGELRRAVERDREAIDALYAHSYPGETLEWLNAALVDYPAVVVVEDGELVGYCITRKFGPDLLEISTIAVARERRGRGVGSTLLLGLGVAAVVDGWAGIVAVNSMGYPGKVGGRLAESFYTRNGYTQVMDTGISLVFVKHLAPLPRAEEL